MEAVILFSHGSLLCGSGETLDFHAERLRNRFPTIIIEIGYLNYSDPAFNEAVAACLSQGADRITVLPYFLAPGYFVNKALPKSVKEAQAVYPSLQFVIAEPIGYDQALASAIIESAAKARSKEFWFEDRDLALQQCRIQERCPLYSSTGCPKPLRKPDVNAESECVRSNSFHDAALLALVHGSPTASANDEFLQVLEVIKTGHQFAYVQQGFLECNEPSIPEAIDLCAAAGVKNILVVPYFLHTGRHVVKDLPELLADGSMRHPGIELYLGDFLGRSPIITDILAERLFSTKPFRI